MSLDPHMKDPLYILGRVAGLVRRYYPDIRIDDPARPDMLLAILVQGAKERGAGDALNEGIAQLLDGVGPMPVGRPDAKLLSAFWLGYHHQQFAQQIRISAAQLPVFGDALFGPQWEAALASALKLASGRRVREWLAQDSVPVWAAAEIYALLQVKRSQIAALATMLEIAPVPEAVSGSAEDGADRRLDLSHRILTVESL